MARPEVPDLRDIRLDIQCHGRWQPFPDIRALKQVAVAWALGLGTVA